MCAIVVRPEYAQTVRGAFGPPHTVCAFKMPSGKGSQSDIIWIPDISVSIIME